MTKVLKQVSTIMSQPEHPTAVVCYNDELAIQIMDVIRSLGLRIPADVSVTGCDDFVLGRYIKPRLTTLEHPKEKMGLDAGTMIVKMIEGEPVESIKYEMPPHYNESVAKRN